MNKRIRKKKLNQSGPLIPHYPVYPFGGEGYVNILDLTIPQVKEHIRNHPEEWRLEEFSINGKIKRGLRIEVYFSEDYMHIEMYKNRRLVGGANLFPVEGIFIEVE
jgi:hypothetical protein